MLIPDEVAIRKDAEKWCDIATAEGVWDRKAEEILWLLSEIDRLRSAVMRIEAVRDFHISYEVVEMRRIAREALGK